jgi:hypothetical protein
MGSWKDFIAEIPIINRRAEGIFVKADDVLDLWEERNKLRAQLNGDATAGVAAAEPIPAAAPVDPGAEAQVREQIAREAEEFAFTYTRDPDLQTFAVELLRSFADRIRPRNDQDAADFLAGVEIPPAAEPIPAAEPVEAWIPSAEPVPEANPFDFGKGHGG